jgi:hypothetical protein
VIAKRVEPDCGCMPEANPYDPKGPDITLTHSPECHLHPEYDGPYEARSRTGRVVHLISDLSSGYAKCGRPIARFGAGRGTRRCGECLRRRDGD